MQRRAYERNLSITQYVRCVLVTYTLKYYNKIRTLSTVEFVVLLLQFVL